MSTDEQKVLSLLKVFKDAHDLFAAYETHLAQIREHLEISRKYFGNVASDLKEFLDEYQNEHNIRLHESESENSGEERGSP